MMLDGDPLFIDVPMEDLDMPTTDQFTNKGDPNIAEIGDNSEAFAKDFDSAMKEQIGLNAQRATLNAKISKARKGFKANGIELGKLDATIRMLEWSPAEVREHFAVEQQYARLAGLPIGTQVDMFAHAEDDEVAKIDWTSRGYSDAMLGKKAEVPKGCPPEHQQDYLNGHGGAKWWSDGDASKDIH